jgi:hypothetical protein
MSIPILERSVIESILADYANLGDENPAVTPDPNPPYTESRGQSAEIWNIAGTAHIDMGIALSTDDPEFVCDTANPYEEPNHEAGSTEYNFSDYFGWKVVVGTNLVITYHVREAREEYLLRTSPANKPETDCFNRPAEKKKQARRKGSDKRIVKIL